jgi:hypothetical protein
VAWGLAWGACPHCLPVRRGGEDPPDPERILRSLPDRERGTFLAEYRLALDDARDPAGWPELLRFLRLWSFRAIAVNQPGYCEAWEQVSAGGGMLLASLSARLVRT